MLEFQIKGVKIRFTFLFFWMFTLFFLLDQSGILILGILAAFIHELGHVIAFLLVKDLPEVISFEITGIRLVRAEHPISYSKEIFQLLMGSGTNFIVFCLLFFSLNEISRLSLFAVSHLILGIFNLLPVHTLDGGRILQLLLERRIGMRNAYLMVKVCSFLILIPLLVISIIIYMKQQNFSLFLLCIWLGILCIKE